MNRLGVSKESVCALIHATMETGELGKAESGAVALFDLPVVDEL
jgi:hypothetical protein